MDFVVEGWYCNNAWLTWNAALKLLFPDSFSRKKYQHYLYNFGNDSSGAETIITMALGNPYGEDSLKLGEQNLFGCSMFLILGLYIDIYTQFVYLLFTSKHYVRQNCLDRCLFLTEIGKKWVLMQQNTCVWVQHTTPSRCLSLQAAGETKEVCSWHSAGHSGTQPAVTARQD